MKYPINFFLDDHECSATRNAAAASWKSTLDRPGFRTPTNSAPRLIAAGKMQRPKSEFQKSPPRNNITSTAPFVRRYCRPTHAPVNWVAKYRWAMPGSSRSRCIAAIASRIPANRPLFKRRLALRAENRSICGIEGFAALHSPKTHTISPARPLNGNQALHLCRHGRCELLERAPEVGQKPESRLVIFPVNSCDGQTNPFSETVYGVAHRVNRLDKLTTQCDGSSALSFN